jgi:hypothetical protein
MKKLFAVMMAATLVGCATPVELKKQTTSGYPEAVFPNATVEEVKEKLMEGCSSKGVMVQDVQSHSVTCGKTMSGGDAMIATLAMGNSYSTTPERKIRFMIFQKGSGVKVTAQQWVELQMALGQTRKQELNTNNQRNDMQDFL